MEGDIAASLIASASSGFLSTPSAWRATVWHQFHFVCLQFLSTPSAWRATLVSSELSPVLTISIHALRMEGDASSSRKFNSFFQFLSTPSAWRATDPENIYLVDGRISIHALRMEGDGWDFFIQSLVDISIHALRMEGDSVKNGEKSIPSDFYPRPPHGGRLRVTVPTRGTWNFYPRPPHGGRLGIGQKAVCRHPISIHALRMEGDVFLKPTIVVTHNFYPRPPHGGRLDYDSLWDYENDFYPRPPHGGRPANHACASASLWISIHALRMEGDSKHAEVQACISAAYLKCSTRKAAASRRCADLGGRVVLFHQLSRLVLGRARCEPRGEGMCDRGSHRRSAILKVHSSRMSSWLH